MSSFILKLLAIIAMTADHIGAVFFPLGARFYPYNIILRTVGRLTMPIMCFFIGEGYRKTKNRGKYLLRLFVFALVSEIPFRLLLKNEVNVMFTLLLGFCALWASDILKEKLKTDNLRIIVYLTAMVISILTGSDWDYIGILLIVAFYHGAENPVKRILYPLGGYIFVFVSAYFEALFLTGFQSFYINWIQFAGVFSIPVLMAYNGKRGPAMKYFFYIYYPLHMTVLWVITQFGG